jgi:hypothetical protein
MDACTFTSSHRLQSIPGPIQQNSLLPDDSTAGPESSVRRRFNFDDPQGLGMVGRSEVGLKRLLSAQPREARGHGLYAFPFSG